ncbi:MAG: hypothetical protein HY911_05130 [Desulfobacterales bacterium]|nr:hypothetical protein [Desulfobacterales bacterium]
MVRTILLLIILPSVYYFFYWVIFSLVPVGEQYWVRNLLSLLTAAGLGWFFWKTLGRDPKNALSYMICGAILIGSIGFGAGFFGPMIFTPGANQGPLLGIFFTGPLGFIIGGIAGLVYSTRSKKKTI